MKTEMNGAFIRFLTAILAFCGSLRGEVLRVPQDYASIKSAVFAAGAGDVVEVGDGFYFEGNIVLDKAITLRARNPFRAVIYEGEESRFAEAIFIIKAPVSIEGFILKNGLRGILQRGSPDVPWEADNLAILNMKDAAISIDAVEGNVGQGTVRGVMIDNCKEGISTNDAHSMDVSQCLIANCWRALSGYNHLRFQVDRTMIWNCRMAFREAKDSLPPPRSSAIIRGVKVEVVDAGSTSRDLTMPLTGNLFLDQRELPGEKNPGMIGRGLALAIAGDIHLSLRDFSLSLPFYRAALKSGQESLSEEVTWRAYAGLALAEEQIGDFPAALEDYRKAVLYLERLRGKLPMRIFNPGFFKDKAQVFVSFIHFLNQRHKTEPSRAYLEEAFACAERSKARGFLDSLEENGLDFSAGMSPAVLSEGKRLSAEVSRYQLELTSRDLPPGGRSELLADLEKVENSYRDLMIRARRDTPAYPGRQYPGPLGYEEIRAKVLPQGTALADFLLGEKRSFAFWATRDSLLLAELPPAAELLALVQRYLRFLTLKKPGRFLAEEGGERLFDILLGPFRAEMDKDIKRIIIVPDGLLCYLPFESLMTGSEVEDEEKHFLVEEFEISYAPSASALVRLVERDRYRSSRKDLVAISVPEPPSRKFYLFGYPVDLSKLRHAGEEVEAIGKLFREENRAILKGTRAAEEKVKRYSLDEFRYIHVAAHGIFDDRNWRRSGLLLWREKESAEDGILQLRDIYLLDLHSDLVVLSACQSGRGNIDTGEGIIGLTGGFLFAGSRAVLVSLWNIADRSTAGFMAEFYSLLRKGETPAKALQEVKKAMIRSAYGHPFYWAAFILTGDAQSYSISK